MSEDNPRTAHADALVEALHDGQAGEPGHFTLDPAQAREKLAAHLQEDPDRYVLLLVRAAIQRRATRIRVDTGPRRLQVAFDGDPFTREDLVRRYDAVLGEPSAKSRPGLRELTLGLLSASHRAVDHITLESGAEAPVTLTMRPDGSEALASPEAPRLRDTVVEIHLARTAGDEEPAAHHGAVLTPRAEVWLLRQWCRYAPIPITLDGQLISDGGSRFAVAVAARDIAEETVVGHVGLFPWEDAQPELLILKDGVVVETVTLEGRFPEGFVAVLESPDLQLDLSLGRVVRDEAYQQLLKVCKAAA